MEKKLEYLVVMFVLLDGGGGGGRRVKRGVLCSVCYYFLCVLCCIRFVNVLRYFLTF